MKVLKHFIKVYLRMRPGCHFAAVAAISLMTSWVFEISPAAAASDACAEVTVLPSPFAPWTGAPLR